MKKIIYKNLILFVVGFCLYITIETLFRGYSYLWSGIMGGLAVVILDKINNYISWDIPLIIQMLIGGIVITVIEAITGLIALKVFGVRMWDYSNLWGSALYGLVCPLFSFFWVLLSGVGILLADAINYYVLHEEPRPYYRGIDGMIIWMMPKMICGGNRK